MKLLGVVFIIILSISAHAADDKGNFTVLSVGNKSCGTFVKEYKEKGWEKLINSVWVGGYLTAINEHLRHGKNITKGVDPEARDLWLYNYCQQNPLNHLEDATSNLYLEFLKK